MNCCGLTKWLVLAGFLAVGLVMFTKLSTHSNETDGAAIKTLFDNHPDLKGEQLVSDVQEEAEAEAQLATFGGGCFWCTEAVFEEIEGVISVSSGYMGGHVENPTYEQVCNKTTGHAEVVQIKFDPAKVSFQALLEVHFATHNPTTLNRQGADEGPQYRSAIFYHSDEQKEIADRIKARLNELGAYDDPIVTEITEASKYYIAEDYHQNFYNLNPNQGYCRAVIAPKMEKFREVFKGALKNPK